MNYKTRQLVLIIFVSVVLICIPIIGSYEFKNEESMLNSIYFQKRFIASILVVIFFYLNYFYLIPKFYFPKRYWLYTFIVIVCFVIVIKLPNILLFNTGIHPSEYAYRTGGYKNNFKRNDLGIYKFLFDKNSYLFVISFCISILLRLNIQMSAINDEKLKSEVSYLKAQINPHFLFNTLNSLYALSLEKSDQTPEAILKLSSIMRYVVTESSTDFVPLKKELNYIEDYIELQKLRMVDVLNFKFEIKGKIENQKIAPLLLIPFIENAFKYGLNPEKESLIKIEINIFNNELFLNVTNDKTVKNILKKDKTETGIENTLLRLQYIYPEKHTLEILENEVTYNLQLKLNLE